MSAGGASPQKSAKSGVCRRHRRSALSASIQTATRLGQVSVSIGSVVELPMELAPSPSASASSWTLPIVVSRMHCTVSLASPGTNACNPLLSFSWGPTMPTLWMVSSSRFKPLVWKRRACTMVPIASMNRTFMVFANEPGGLVTIAMNASLSSSSRNKEGNHLPCIAWGRGACKRYPSSCGVGRMIVKLWSRCTVTSHMPENNLSDIVSEFLEYLARNVARISATCSCSKRPVVMLTQTTTRLSLVTAAMVSIPPGLRVLMMTFTMPCADSTATTRGKLPKPMETAMRIMPVLNNTIWSSEPIEYRSTVESMKTT
mmetsp:Transcript_32210/g.68533  ORF Transcript_32210/g.68533 Transcript_32210/m.68533 type:complete len:315 (+) Transcript_32210:282-1226(+)